jgi:hypothetical protein
VLLRISSSVSSKRLSEQADEHDPISKISRLVMLREKESYDP